MIDDYRRTDSASELVEIIHEVRRRWRMKLALRGAMGVAGLRVGVPRSWLAEREGTGGDVLAAFEAALKHDRDGCHQTLIDFGDLLRKSGRIGDAVRMYRKAVAAVPGDPEWKQTLKEAERELLTGYDILIKQTSPSVSWIKSAP